MDTKRKHINFPITDEEHLKLKIFAAKQRKTMKDLFLECLEKVYPNWKDENENSSK